MLQCTLEESQRLYKLIDGIDIPPSYYEKAAKRYKSISEWLCRKESLVAQYEPTIYVQGSFRLGLVNRPLGPREEYDLDLVCEVRGRAKDNITQEQLKALIGWEIKLYAKAHGILEEPIERNRCWRIDYADEVNFHIDNLPCVPEDAAVIAHLLGLGVDLSLAQTAIALTCKAHPEYKIISSNWPTSNPAGYAVWFEGQFGSVGVTRRILLVESGVYESIDAVPTYALKTPLQHSIQLQKRHRDFMFRTRTDLKPISMIITTLSALAYRGEEDLFDALNGILERMPQYVRAGRPRIPNPVNPGEDFADKWAAQPVLEENFWNWHKQACRDFGALTSLEDPTELRRLSESSLGIRLPEERGVAPALIGIPKRIAPLVVVERGPKPWA